MTSLEDTVQTVERSADPPFAMSRLLSAEVFALPSGKYPQPGFPAPAKPRGTRLTDFAGVKPTHRRVPTTWNATPRKIGFLGHGAVEANTWKSHDYATLLQRYPVGTIFTIVYRGRLVALRFNSHENFKTRFTSVWLSNDMGASWVVAPAGLLEGSPNGQMLDGVFVSWDAPYHSVMEVVPRAFSTLPKVIASYETSSNGTDTQFVDRTASWIWSNDIDYAVLWRLVHNPTGAPMGVVIHVAADDSAAVYVNNALVGNETYKSRNVPNYPRYAATLKPGANVIEFRCTNIGGGYGLLFAVVNAANNTIVCRSDEDACRVPKPLWPTLLTACFSCRCVTSRHFELPVFRLRRSSDNALQDFYTDCVQSYLSTGPDNSGTSFEAWVGGGTAYVHTWYDQSGTGNNATNTANNATQPKLVKVANAEGSAEKYVINFDRLAATVLNIPPLKPNAVICQFWNSTVQAGTILSTQYDYGIRAENTITGNGGDWYFTGQGAKQAFVNGVAATTKAGLSQWNTLAYTIQTPVWSTIQTNNQDSSFTRIGQDGYDIAKRSILGYMSEMILCNTHLMSGTDVKEHFDNRLL